MLPARVLHKWDFACYPVSCCAAEFLHSTQQQPLLCVPAINPGLCAKGSGGLTRNLNPKPYAL